ncbi:MAG: DUF4169 family protein [Xanthobacteraceae bacterium]
MGNVVNLRVARKRARSQRAAQRAAENRLVHGLSKAERAVGTALRTKASRDLDRHQIKNGEGQQ